MFTTINQDVLNISVSLSGDLIDIFGKQNLQNELAQNFALGSAVERLAASNDPDHKENAEFVRGLLMVK